MVLESINYTRAIILLVFAMFEYISKIGHFQVDHLALLTPLQNFRELPFLPLFKIFPFLEDVKTIASDWSAPFPGPATLITVTLRQFKPDQKRRNHNRKKN